MVRRFRPSLAALIVIGTIASSVWGQSGDLASYFGFAGLEVVKIGRQAGPLSVADMNADDLADLIVVNNRASRIEIHYQKSNASPDDALSAPARVNEFPEHWRYRRQLISVTHQVMVLVPHDFDDDGLRDLIYIGYGGELVFMRQSSTGVFEMARRHRVRNLAATRDGLAVADMIGDERPELIATVRGEIHVWPLDGDSIGQPIKLAAGNDMVAFVVEDFNGDGRQDIAGVLPDDAAPVRLWLGGIEDGVGAIGAQIRFEMPSIRECAAVRLPNEPAARLAVIEGASKRIVLYEVTTEHIEESGDRNAALRVHSFTDSGNRKRDHVVVDVDGDGYLDLVATDTEANALVVYRQAAGKGMQAGESHPSLSDLEHLVAGNVDDDPYAELFVLSEKEGVVGRCDVTAEGVPFPTPLPISAGHTPTALNLVELESGTRVAVVAKESRDYVIDLIDMDGKIETIKLGKLSRSPETIVALDADQDGRTDLLLFTRDKPMTMVYAGEDGFELKEAKDMGQFGLVQAASADNIAVFDIDDDGRPELLIADKNFVRAVRYERDPAGGSPGWQVVTQINALDASSKLVSLATLGSRIIAADGENDRLVVMAQGDQGRWREAESLTVRGFSFNSIHPGAFSGSAADNILAVGDDGFAVIRLAGERIALRELVSWRTSDERRRQHEIASGDVNSDGFADMITLDAGEQMCEIFTFSEAKRMIYAMGFQIYDSRLFTGGDAREYEPSQIIVEDVTGDGGADLVMLAHDRLLIYPQLMQ